MYGQFSAALRYARRARPDPRTASRWGLHLDEPAVACKRINDWLTSDDGKISEKKSVGLVEVGVIDDHFYVVLVLISTSTLEKTPSTENAGVEHLKSGGGVWGK